MKIIKKLFAKENTSLQNALQANAIFSGISGLLLILLSATIAEILGISQRWILIDIGIGLLAWEYLLLKETLKPEVSRSMAIVAIIGDILWVLGSVAILGLNLLPLLVPGKWMIAIIADIVLGFAFWQFFALRKRTS